VSVDQSLLWKMYSALVGIGVVCAILVASVYLLTSPFIAANKAAALNQAVLSVLGKVDKIQALQWHEDRFIIVESNQATSIDGIFAGYDKSGSLLGYAIAANGMGYQDTIELIYGYSPTLQQIIGIRVLENRETPGLGNRIASDSAFLRQFRHYNVQLDASNTRLANDIRIAKKGRQASPGEIDSISGATISSKAVARILNKSSKRWVPRLYAQGNRDDNP